MPHLADAKLVKKTVPEKKMFLLSFWAKISVAPISLVVYAYFTCVDKSNTGVLIVLIVLVTDVYIAC
jgi:hypothetical protein